jgi:CRISPR-associated protein Csm4
VKRFEITIKPQSGIGTPLKGDTLFGHFCWQAANQPELVDGGLEAALEMYPTEPFAVFSSAFPKLAETPPRYILKRPDLPLHMFLEDKGESDRFAYYQGLKNQKKKKWMVLIEDNPLSLESAVFLDDRELAEIAGVHLEQARPRSRMEGRDGLALCKWFDQPHNTINRLTGTTGKGSFAPYNMQNLYYTAGTELAVFVLFNEKWTDIERVVKALANIGRFGFGRDASTGLGRFEVSGCKESPQPLPKKSEGIYTLAPCLPGDKDTSRRCRFTPFTRFGRHGDRLAISRNPFKAPVIMADEGAVFLPESNTPFAKPYIGSAVAGVSKVQPTAVVQGYAPYLPIRLENKHE